MFFLQKSESYFNSHTTFRNDPIKGVVVDNTNGSTPKVVGFKN